MSDTKIKNNKVKQLKIRQEWCKGCSICVEFCPQDVLVMENGVAKIENLEACTACGLCELRCPDFAISVEKE